MHAISASSVTPVDFTELEPLPGGWSGETFVAGLPGGERQVVRIYVRDPARAEVDAALLRLVRGLVPVPEVLEARRAAGTLPALLITSYLPGERGDLVLQRLGTADQAVLGTHVGELVATLGGMPLPGPGQFVDGGLGVRSWDLPGGLTQYVEQTLAHRLQHWSSDARAALVEIATRAQDVLDTVTRTCLVHSDLNPKNLLVDPGTLDVTGLVDWEYAHAGHPFTDLGNVLRFDREPAYATAVLDAYERVRGTAAAEALELARAADLWALTDLAARAGENPVADRAEQQLLAIVDAGDLHAEG